MGRTEPSQEHKDSSGQQPLTGIRVLDLSGPMGVYCGKLMADMGADVRFDDNGVDVFVGQRPAGNPPPGTARVPLQEYDPLFSSDQHLLRARSR